MMACKVPEIKGKDGKDGVSSGVSSRVATTAECLTGGFAIETWRDLNSNGKYDATQDEGHQVAVVCNGSRGADGNSVVSLARAASSAECSAGPGQVLEFWTDVNRDGQYQSATDLSYHETILCDGAAGQDGQDGEDGRDGQDGANGQNGQDAILSSGAVGSAVPGKEYSACHHDYLYLSNGWLLFRHQRNGASDQGVGTTGFNVWNVDLSDFSLASEVGGVVYCTLHFDKALKTLRATVVDASDGLSGQTTLIQL